MVDRQGSFALAVSLGTVFLALSVYHHYPRKVMAVGSNTYPKEFSHEKTDSSTNLPRPNLLPTHSISRLCHKTKIDQAYCTSAYWRCDMNDNIIPYVPIADRVKSHHKTSQTMCQQFFTLIDKVVQGNFMFNHDTKIGHLSINIEHLNDLMAELKEGEKIDICLMERHFKDLIYPKYLGTKQIRSPLWNNSDVQVWQFKLNEQASDALESVDYDDAEYQLDQTIGYLRIWRSSLETNTTNPQTVYQANDLVYVLSDLEQKLVKVQTYITQ